MSDVIILYESETEERARITTIHYMPDDPVHGLPEEVKARGIRVQKEAIPPEPVPPIGKYVIGYINPTNGDIWYEFFDRPLTKDEEVELLKEQLAQAQANNLIALEAIAQLYETLIMQGGE
jgi:hypothetical protein